MTSYYRDPTFRPESLPALPRHHHVHGLHSDLSPRRTVMFEGIQPRPPTLAKSSLEAQDQLKVYRDELKRKDELIQQLSRYDTNSSFRPPGRPYDPTWVDMHFSGGRQHVEAVRSEAAALQARVEKLQHQLREAQSDVESKESKIRELAAAAESARENEVRLSALTQTLRDRLTELESHAGSFETAKGRSEFTITSLQKEIRDNNERIADLETRLRKLLEEREVAEQKCVAMEKKYADMVSQLNSILRTDDVLSPSLEQLVAKVSDIVQENALLKGKLVTLNEMLTNTELESKASRETIMRLVSEVGREQKVANRYNTNYDSLRLERDNAVASKKDLERETESLRDRLTSCQRALDAARDELTQKESRLSSLSREVRETEHSFHSNKTQYNLFKEQIASLLSEAFHQVEPYEEAIRERILALQDGNKEKAEHINVLEEKLRKCSEQLEKQYDMNKTVVRRTKQTEANLVELEERLRSAEGDLAAGDMLRDNFKTDKERYLRFMQGIGAVMKMDQINFDVGLDMATEALISRAEQLVRQESDALAGKSTHLYNLQRKVKALKEQLESKELHIDLLRKKITSLEEKVLGRSDLERERDTESLRVKKLERLVEKYKVQLTDSRHEVTNLKAQLLGSSELRVRSLEQKKEMEELVQQVDELERIRQKQAKKIANLKEEVEIQDHNSQEKRVVSDNAVHALSSELRTTKNALDVVTSREKTLLDFRNVVARMLGLDINTLAIPDYEIISRLESLIQAHHSHAFTTCSLDDALADMGDGFIAGYEQARRDPVRTVTGPRRSRTRVRTRTRARSVSPIRRDPRSY
ncbi:coiled-coil domain-containing protein 170-like isoform X2 [Liolophura sinensis]|uniref:coiled-coil domain-containing protein 170-like isoform X2 n=1 Tax=Liolophura sinensis TaxID=3198878 RepID=UPI00315890A3